MTPDKRELLRLCDKYLAAFEESNLEEAQDGVTIARALKSLLTRPEAQGETPRTDSIVEGIASIEDRYAPLRDLARQLERALSAKREGFVTVPVELLQRWRKVAFDADNLRWKTEEAIIAAAPKEGE